MGAMVCTKRSISYETDPPEDNWTDWVRADVFIDGVGFDSSGLRKLSREECLELAAWLVEAAELIQPPVIKKPVKPKRARGRPPGGTLPGERVVKRFGCP